MTFQGDVGGIGLADLLQSLARGRDGTLTLLGRDGLQCSLGVEGGLIHFLPEPAEEPSIWRERARAAWAGDPTSRIDSVRMTEIARAHRIEIVYCLLDSDAVHFRFTPGPVPKPSEDPAISKAETGFTRPGARRDGVWCAPLPVDALLLEYARLKDEAAGLGAAFHVDVHSVLRLLDPSMMEGDQKRFATECDGASSLREIADRMGWALRQMRIVTAVAMLQGKLCEAQPEELLNLAQKELLAGNLERAASRLNAWNRSAPPGPVTEQDAEFFVHEWNAGRLQPALKLVERTLARSILRRVDSVIFNPMASAERWKEYAKEQHPDPISAFRVLVCQIRTGSEGGLPPMRELLSAARAFNERRQSMRAAAILRIAAERQPETAGIRMELGLGFLNAGLPDEGAPWVMEAAKALVDEKQGDKAVNALRALLELKPSHREARRLLSRARAGAVRRQLTGGHAVLLGAGVAVIAVIGFVHFRMRRSEQRKIAAVHERIADPDAALDLLDQQFPGDISDNVNQLRADIEKRRQEDEAARRSSWTVQYREAQTECSGGDPLLGLRKAMEVPPPPKSPYDTEEWPVVSDLFNLIAARGESAFRDLAENIHDDKEQMHAERRILKLLEDLRAETVGKEDRPEVRRFVPRLDDLKARVEERAEQRASSRAEYLKRDNLARQDLLLAAARAHAKAGDHTRALAVYQELASTDPSGKLEAVLGPEIKVERDRHDALVNARELALAGKHAEAKATLTAVLENANDYLLPWKVVTVPSGARARFPDGTERVTPFTLETAFGERITMSLAREGSEPVQLELTDPADQIVYLTRSPESWWHSHGRVEATPLSIGDDRILCDRSGTIVRMARDGSLAWSQKITSLAGIARSPALLGGQREKCVFVAEDGQTWICSLATGELDGPFAVGSPPVEGPTRCAEGVWAKFRDGKTALWTTELAPAMSVPGQGAALECTPADTDADRLAVLRRSVTSATSLKSPWTGWTVEIGEKGCGLVGPGEREASASIRREGQWTFVAWEAPGAQSPQGRLWIADGLGLRSYKP
jgi:tetratricopeptide (TPR) repeat protein